MRKSLEVVALFALFLLFWITYAALEGPNRLPDRIATHFDAAGNANGWGPPTVLWVLPVAALGLYLLMSVVARFPSAWNYPVRVTRENLDRLQSVALNMVALLKTELVCFFALLQWAIVHSARSGHGRAFALLVPVLLVVVFGTIGLSFMAMLRAARPQTGSEGSGSGSPGKLR